MFQFGVTNESRYMRITQVLSAGKTLQMPDENSVRFFGKTEADKLAETIRKRNVFARHSWENNFYVQRIRALTNHTIIEVFLQGDPNEIAIEAEKRSDLIEKLVVLSSTTTLNRNNLQKKLGVGLRPQTQIDFIFGNEMRYLKSRSKPKYSPKGLEITDQFTRRFSRLGVSQLYKCCLKGNDINKRLRRSLEWLYESRLEIDLASSIVKTAIALETLLIFNETESLARSLSERTAFIVINEPKIRRHVSDILKTFYDARSGVVHGSKKKKRKVTPELLESVDRIAFLLLLTISANHNIWPTTERLNQWCEIQRWAEPAIVVRWPFQKITLTRAIKLSKITTT